MPSGKYDLILWTVLRGNSPGKGDIVSEIFLPEPGSVLDGLHCTYFIMHLLIFLNTYLLCTFCKLDINHIAEIRDPTLVPL